MHTPRFNKLCPPVVKKMQEETLICQVCLATEKCLWQASYTLGGTHLNYIYVVPQVSWIQNRTLYLKYDQNQDKTQTWDGWRMTNCHWALYCWAMQQDDFPSNTQIRVEVLHWLHRHAGCMFGCTCNFLLHSVQDLNSNNILHKWKFLHPPPLFDFKVAAVTLDSGNRKQQE